MKHDVLPAVAGSTLYEFRMQLKRKALWIVMAPFVLWGVGLFPNIYFQRPDAPPGPSPWVPPADMSTLEVVAGWALVLQSTVPIAVGIMLADRLARDRRMRVADLFEALPASPGGRLFGKYLGATLATLVPVFLAYAGLIAYTVAIRGDLAAVPLGLLAFLAINLPGLLFVAAFSVSCPAVMWVPLYQFLFVGYWIWGNQLSPASGIPTLTGTVLTPLGEHVAHGFFGANTIYANGASAWEGAVSVGLLLGLGALALYVAHKYLRRQQARQ
jgi:hypothetical protein